MVKLNSKTDCARLVVALAESFGQEWTPVKTEAYIFAFEEELQRTDLQKLRRFILQSHTWMPKPAEFGQALRIVGPMEILVSQDDVNWVLTLCERHGEDFYSFAGEYLAYVKDSIMGFKIRQTPQQRDSQIKEKFWTWVQSVQTYRENFDRKLFHLLPNQMPKEEFPKFTAQIG